MSYVYNMDGHTVLDESREEIIYDSGFGILFVMQEWWEFVSHCPAVLELYTQNTQVWSEVHFRFKEIACGAMMWEEWFNDEWSRRFILDCLVVLYWALIPGSYSPWLVVYFVQGVVGLYIGIFPMIGDNTRLLLTTKGRYCESCDRYSRLQ